MRKKGIFIYFKLIIFSLICAASIIIVGSNLKVKAANYSNADSGHFYLLADGSISAEFTVSDNDLNMKGWLLCLFTSEPTYDSSTKKLNDSNDLHPHSLGNCKHYFFTANTQRDGKLLITWSADSYNQKSNWSADGKTESEDTLADYSLLDTEYYIVIGPRHYNSNWGGEGIGAGTDNYWENCDLYVGKLSEVTKDYVALTKELITDIGTVEYTNESKIKINLARTSYNSLNDEQKALVTNYKTLTDAEAAYKSIEDPAKANETMALIDAIGTVEYTYESKEAIDEAREAYDALTDDQKALVTNYETLTEAEAAYKKIDDPAKANETIALIDNIGTVEYTYESKEAIDEARASYDSLTDDQKALVSEEKLKVLTDAETLYQKLEEDNDIASETMALIDNIGTVEYTEESKEAIDEARTSYDALTSDQKALVTNYDTLTDAETAYKNMDDSAKANATVTLIDAIGTVEYTEESKNAINEARVSYNALTDDQKALVTNYETLTDAEAAYKKLDDPAKANATIALIDAIGDVAYVEASKVKIDAARTAYDALTDEQKALVTNYKKLTDAEVLYLKLKIDNDKADNVKALIDEIGTVDYNDDTGAKIGTARTAYDALTDDQKALVTNYATLTAKEASYKDLVDTVHALEVVALIDEIDTVTYSEESREKIDQAKAAYDLLTDDQKVKIAPAALKVLTDAESLYLKLTDDNNKANATKELITSIGKVEYTDACKGKINAARASYNALTNDQKALVNNLSALESSESTYSKLENVVTKINSISSVSYSTNSKEEIGAARKIYDELTQEEKALIPNYNKLEESEKTYTTLEHNHKVFVGWMIALGITLGIVLLLCVVYLLMFFVFNSWTKNNDKLIRVFKIGSKDDKVRLMKMNFVVIYKNKEELLKSKNDIQ